MLSNLKDTIQKQIEKGDEITPFLFLWGNFFQVENFARELLRDAGIDTQSLFLFPDDGQSLKIAPVKEFFSKSSQKPRFKFQIFLIENFSRITREAANSCLKILEEPGFWNIIFLTNASESGVIDTVLSRVQTVRLESHVDQAFSQEYYDMIENYIKHKDMQLISYFFSAKLERKDYGLFLQALVYYAQKNNHYFDFLSEIESDINGLMQGSFSGKYVVDKYLLRM